MDTKSATYERLREQVAALKRAPDAGNRQLLWLEVGVLAVARNEVGRVEVFVVGAEPLVATTGSVSDLLAHQVWTSAQGEVAATRVVLPGGDHFDPVAALVCIELVENGLADDSQAAFSAVEPLLALALTRESVGNEVVNGLIGELCLLRRLLVGVVETKRSEVLASWAGSTPSARDFQLGTVGVEVKTTQGSASRHQVSGFHQVELGSSNGGVPETDLFLLSLGLEWLETTGPGTTLPELVDDVVGLLVPEDRPGFLARLKQYGGDASIGYDHENDKSKIRYSRRFQLRFERLYDLADDLIRLLRTEHVIGYTHVELASVTFRVSFDSKIRGDLNPRTGWTEIVPHVLMKAGFDSRT